MVLVGSNPKYEECLALELAVRDIGTQRQVPLPLEYKGIRLDCGYRIDLVVQDAVVLEVKAVERLLPIHEAQLLTYLRLSTSIRLCSNKASSEGSCDPFSVPPCLRGENPSRTFDPSN